MDYDDDIDFDNDGGDYEYGNDDVDEKDDWNEQDDDDDDDDDDDGEDEDEDEEDEDDEDGHDEDGDGDDDGDGENDDEEEEEEEDGEHQEDENEEEEEDEHDHEQEEEEEEDEEEDPHSYSHLEDEDDLLEDDHENEEEDHENEDDECEEVEVVTSHEIHDIHDADVEMQDVQSSTLTDIPKKKKKVTFQKKKKKQEILHGKLNQPSEGLDNEEEKKAEFESLFGDMIECLGMNMKSWKALREGKKLKKSQWKSIKFKKLSSWYSKNMERKSTTSSSTPLYQQVNQESLTTPLSPSESSSSSSSSSSSPSSNYVYHLGANKHIQEQFIRDCIQSMIKTQGFIKHHIDSFNKFISEWSLSIVREFGPFTVDSKKYPRRHTVENLNPRWGIPGVREADGTFRQTTPEECISRGLNYVAPFIVDIKHQVFECPSDTPSTLPNNDKPWKLVECRTILEITLGDVPVMLGSELDLSRFKSPIDKQSCPNTPKGIFILHGSEKVIIPQKYPMYNHPRVKIIRKQQRFSHECEIRAVNETKLRSTSTLHVYLDKSKTPRILVQVPFIKKLKIPLTAMFRLIGVNNKAEQLKFIVGRSSKKAPADFMHLAECVLEPDAEESRMSNMELLQWIGDKGSNAPADKRVRYIMHIFANEFLPNMGLERTKETLKRRAIFLGVAVRKLLLVKLGYLDEDDRDDNFDSRLNLPGMLCALHFRQLVRASQHSTTVTMHRSMEQGKYVNVVDCINPKRITGGFSYFISQGIFGMTRTGLTQTGVSQMLTKFNHWSMWSHMRRINTPINKKNKTTGPRMLHPSTWGRKCPISTPEGESCGLVNNLPIAAHIRIGYDSHMIKNWLFRHGVIEILDGHLESKLGLTSLTSVTSLTTPMNMTTSSSSSSSHDTPSTPLIFRQAHTNAVESVPAMDPLPSISHPPLQRSSSSLSSNSSTTNNNNINNNNSVTSVASEYAEVYLNAWPLGFHPHPQQLCESFREARRNRLLPFDVSIALMTVAGEKQVHIGADTGCVLRPLFVTKNMHKIPQVCAGIDRKTDKFWKTLLSHGIVEYLDSMEEGEMLVAMFPEEITQYHTHCEIHPLLILSLEGTRVLLAHHNQGPRNFYTAAMVRHSVGAPPSYDFDTRMDTCQHMLMYPQKPLVTTWTEDIVAQEQMMNGSTVVLAIMADKSGVNDALIINRASVERGLFRSLVFKTTRDQEKSTGSDLETFVRPLSPSRTKFRKDGNYSKVGADGLMEVGAKVNYKDVMANKIQHLNPNQKRDPNKKEGEAERVTDKSILSKNREPAVMDRISITNTVAGNKSVRLRTRSVRIPEIGDKFAALCAQKGVLAELRNPEDMPFNCEGISPDLIFNLHGIPSRMTIAFLKECFGGKLAALIGQRLDGTTFREDTQEQMEDLLKKEGFSSDGKEIMYDGRTGEMYEVPIFMGIPFYMRMKQMVVDKEHARAQGPRVSTTRQPQEGRRRDGGIRFGEMETANTVDLGASQVLIDRLGKQSDGCYSFPFCNRCGLLAEPPLPTKNGTVVAQDDKSKSIQIIQQLVQASSSSSSSSSSSTIPTVPFSTFVQPHSTSTSTNSNAYQIIEPDQRDPTQPYCRACKCSNSVRMVSSLPYSCKLLIQELAAVNIAMRFELEDLEDELY